MYLAEPRDSEQDEHQPVRALPHHQVLTIPISPPTAILTPSASARMNLFTPYLFLSLSPFLSLLLRPNTLPVYKSMLAHTLPVNAIGV